MFSQGRIEDSHHRCQIISLSINEQPPLSLLLDSFFLALMMCVKRQ
jgi:hypothetical protein